MITMLLIAPKAFRGAFLRSFTTRSCQQLRGARLANNFARIAASTPRSNRFFSNSSESTNFPLSDRSDSSPNPNPEREEPPSYQMTFTCKQCFERSSHRISKQGYHSGTILISCPGCKNRHLVSDHLKIFSDTSITLEDILKEKGQLIKKGALNKEGNVEFWDDNLQNDEQEKAKL